MDNQTILNRVKTIDPKIFLKLGFIEKHLNDIYSHSKVKIIIMTILIITNV